MPDTDIHHLKGKEILPYLTELAHLRMTVFKEYPYLYEGDLAYEEKYLQTYADCNESIMVLAINTRALVHHFTNSVIVNYGFSILAVVVKLLERICLTMTVFKFFMTATRTRAIATYFHR